MPDTIIDLLRHGEPRGGSMYRGNSIDDPLSDKGWQQMWQSVGEYSSWQHIISSPMLRCKEFAELLAKNLNIPVHIEDNFKEVGFGSWEGLTREQVKNTNLTEYNNFYSDPVNKRPLEAEDLNSFIQRVTTSYNKIVHDFKNQNILIVAHAGVIRSILATTVQAPAMGMYNFKIDNACFSRINANSCNIIFTNQFLINI